MFDILKPYCLMFNTSFSNNAKVKNGSFFEPADKLKYEPNQMFFNILLYFHHPSPS